MYWHRRHCCILGIHCVPNRHRNCSTHKRGTALLTKDDFIVLYNKCGEILHARNPFTEKPLTIDVLYPVTQWVSRIHTLLDLHMMHLLGGNKWVVQIPKEGDIHLFLAEPTRETSWPAKERK